jgi:precorrin-6A synthase
MNLHLIGIGTGDPGHLTRAAIAAINAADVILLPEKAGKADLADVRRALLAEVLTNPEARVVPFAMPGREPDPADYLQTVEVWHDAIAAEWQAALASHLPAGGTAALLVWGDPSLYDSTLRIAGRLRGISVSVTPGITAIQALTAAHGVALNTLGGSVALLTGRRLRDEGWPEGVETVVVMLDGAESFSTLDLAGFDIWWGANLGRPEQALLAGPLAEVGPQVAAAKRRVRESVGWTMDIYMLRPRQH